MPRGIIALPPAFAKSLGLLAPPTEHEASKAPEGCEQGYNSWVIVPMGHVLSHIINMSAGDVVMLGYCVLQLRYPNGTPLPFLLMDNWTLHHYTHGTVSSGLLKIDSSRINIAELYIELAPLTRSSWLGSCIAGTHLQTGYVSFSLLVMYTVFPRDFREDGFLICTLSDKFPRISFDIKKQMEEAQKQKKQAGEAQ